MRDESGIIRLNRRCQGSVLDVVPYIGWELADKFADICFQLSQQFGTGGGIPNMR